MKSKKTLLVIVLAFVLLMGGASVLYRQLGETVAAEQLVAQEPRQTEETPDSSADMSAEETPDEPVGDPADETADETTDETVGGSAEESEEESLPKIVAPDFIVYDVQGNEVRLRDYVGKPIVLNFWASWCEPCQMEMPTFQEKYEELGEDIHFLMINSTDGGRETVETAVEFLEENEYTFPVFYDTKSYAAITYGAYSMPITFFIDADGYVIAQAAGAIDGDLLQQGIDMIT